MAAKILLCVGGGIAAYKTPDLVRQLVGAGHEIQVLMTTAAGAFVSELSLATVSGRSVRRELLDARAEIGEPGVAGVGHIELADWPDLVLVVPATANLMARAAHGLADDLVTTTLLATRAPVVFAPAMNTNMWEHPATRVNVDLLRARGASFVGPDSGELACGYQGVGRLRKIEAIVESVSDLVGGCTQTVAPKNRVLDGCRVLVSAGPTRAYLDPVRFISNASTGAMGFEMAQAAVDLGAHVTVVAGPVDRRTLPGISRVDVETGGEMLVAMDRVLAGAGADLVIMVAAVADLVPKAPSETKLTKAELAATLGAAKWRDEVDVLATLIERFGDTTYFLGFAAQTVDGDDPGVIEARLLDLGRDKLKRKGANALFVNRVGVPETGFGGETNAGYLLTRQTDDSVEDLSSGPPVAKLELAHWILRALVEGHGFQRTRDLADV